MKAINLRLPDNLHSALKQLAEDEHRSLNSEIIALLERATQNLAPRQISAPKRRS